jgi:hypothetical protein
MSSTTSEHPVTRPLWKDMAFWYILIYTVLLFVLPVLSYNDEEFGFYQQGYGLGVLLTICFPILWLILYSFAHTTIKKNKELARLQALVDHKCSDPKDGGVP